MLVPSESCENDLFQVSCLASDSLLIVVQSLSRVYLFVTPRSAAHQASLSFTISRGLLKLMFIESVMPSNHLILCHPLSSCPQSFPASRSFPVCIRTTSFYPFICQWTSRLLPWSSYCKYCCNEQWDTWVLINFGFLRVYPRSGISGSLMFYHIWPLLCWGGFPLCPFLKSFNHK